MKALLQISLRASGVAFASQQFLTFVKIGEGVCKLFFHHKKANHASKKVPKISSVLISPVSWRFRVYFMVRFSSKINV